MFAAGIGEINFFTYTMKLITSPTHCGSQHFNYQSQVLSKIDNLLRTTSTSQIAGNVSSYLSFHAMQQG